MSNPSYEPGSAYPPQSPQQPAQYGAPAPAQGQYAPPPQYGAPGQYGTPGPMQPAASNGWATAGLIFGILPTPLLGIIFSIIGLVRAAKVRVGKGRSWVGLILSVLWMIGSIVLVIALAASPAVKKAVQRADPGCVQFESTDANAFTSKIQADAGDPTKLQADLQDMQNQIKSSADKAVNPTAKAAMQKFSSDFQELLDDLNSGTVPSADLQTRLSTDGAAVDTACGH